MQLRRRRLAPGGGGARPAVCRGRRAVESEGDLGTTRLACFLTPDPLEHRASLGRKARGQEPTEHAHEAALCGIRPLGQSQFCLAAVLLRLRQWSDARSLTAWSFALDVPGIEPAWSFSLNVPEIEPETFCMRSRDSATEPQPLPCIPW